LLIKKGKRVLPFVQYAFEVWDFGKVGSGESFIGFDNSSYLSTKTLQDGWMTD
jgi:hypothetical protein